MIISKNLTFIISNAKTEKTNIGLCNAAVLAPQTIVTKQ